ncbi:MAG: polyphosphate kinase 1 [Flammeovirgaceae bacterium]
MSTGENEFMSKKDPTLITDAIPQENVTGNSEQNELMGRDLSWLAFNYRVLEEAKDQSVPLYDRIKFLAIYSSNRDEFFRVRVASLRSFAKAGKKKMKKHIGFKPKSVLKKVLRKVREHQLEFQQTFRNDILPELKAHHIFLVNHREVLKEHHAELTHYFRSKILAYLQPVILSDDRPIPFLENRQLYFAIELTQKNVAFENEPTKHYAILNIPSNYLPRFISLSKVDNKHYFMFLDDVVRLNIQTVFPGYEVNACYSVKMNRDADLRIEDEFSGDLVDKIRKRLKKRNVGVPSRFAYDNDMPLAFINYLMDALQLEEDDLMPSDTYHSLFDLFQLPNPLKPSLEAAKCPSKPHVLLHRHISIFNALDEDDCMLHFPYHSYDYVLRFFNEAAIDPFVTEIKLTVYRVAANSFVANALISAAKNGKNVTVFVELKARFDEENNLKWANKMEEAGVRIIYSMPALKVHAKVAYVERVVGGKKKRYAFLGTGNFNESTAKIYADHGYLTTDEKLIGDLKNVFKFLRRRRAVPEMEHLLVAQINLKERFAELIDREIAHAKAGKKAYLMIKVNNLEDEASVLKLYEASRAGVQVDLLVRSICCAIPQVIGMSENIRIKRIVDMYLEHARIFYFYNAGQEEVYLGSADWMRRNLYSRVEVVFPIYHPRIKQEILKMIQFQLLDNTKARFLNEAHDNLPINKTEGELLFRAQTDAYQWVSDGCPLEEEIKIVE